MKAGQFTPEVRALVLELVRQGATLTAAAGAVGCTAWTISDHARADAAFAQELEAARATARADRERKHVEAKAVRAAAREQRKRERAPVILEPAPGASTDGVAADACVSALLGLAPAPPAGAPGRLSDDERKAKHAQKMRARRAAARGGQLPASAPVPTPASAPVPTPAPAPTPELPAPRHIDRRGLYPAEVVRQALHWGAMACAAALQGAGACRWPDSPTYARARLVLQVPVSADERAVAFVRLLLDLYDRDRADDWMNGQRVHVAREGSGIGRGAVDG